MTLSKYDPLPAGHPFGDFMSSLQGGDAPCCPKPDELRDSNGRRFIAKWVGVNSSARASMFRDRLILAKPTASIIKYHSGGNESMIVLYLDTFEKTITLALPVGADEPGDDWENESAHRLPQTTGASRDSRQLLQETEWDNCVMAPTYN